MILFYNLIYITLITLTILFIINKLLNIKDQRFKIISYLVIISSILINFIFLNPNQSDYSENYLRLIVILALIVFIIILYKMIFKKTLKDIINNKKTTFNNTEINHNYHTNIETLDNSNTFNTSLTNNHLEQNNIVNNIEIGENSIQTNNQDIFSFKNLNESEIMKLFDSNINNIHEDSKDDFLQFLRGFIPENKIIWKGTSGKGETNITYTGIFILLKNILNLPTEKLEKDDRKKLIEFIIKTFKKYNNDTEDYCNEIPFDSLNGAYGSFNFMKYSNFYSN